MTGATKVVGGGRKRETEKDDSEVFVAVAWNGLSLILQQRHKRSGIDLSLELSLPNPCTLSFPKFHAAHLLRSMVFASLRNLSSIFHHCITAHAQSLFFLLTS